MNKKWFFALAFAAAAAPDAHAQVDAGLPQDLPGLWWQPGDSGWAAAVFDHTSAISSVLLVYDNDGRPVWYTAPRLDCHRPEPPWWVNVRCDGAVYKVTGSFFGASSFRAADLTVREVGQWSGDFFTPLIGGVPSQERVLGLDYTTDGPRLSSHGQLPMRIQAVDPAADFLWQDPRYSGLWGKSDEIGWGVGVFVQNDSMFATLFLHGADQQPHWYVAIAKEFPFDEVPNYFAGDVYETRGWADGEIERSGAKSVRRVGAFSLQFGAEPGAPARLNYSIDNIHVSKSIERQP